MNATAKPFWFALVALTGCGKFADSVFCASDGCGWNDGDWAKVASLANPGLPPPDLSNALTMSNDPVVVEMGRMFFFDPAFSGTATQKDAIKRDSLSARVAKGAAFGISCASCYDLGRVGIDTTSAPGHVSVGAGWTDVNALPVVNSAYRQVVFWNGRADSLWALNVAVAESQTTMNGNRLRTAHQIFDRYAPTSYLTSQLMKQLPGVSCNALNALYASIPTMPPDGKPGATKDCQAGDPNEPFNDDFDCKLSKDQKTLVTTLLVIWSKAIAAYEQRLISVQSKFDQFVTEGAGSGAIPAAARRGARLFVGKAACIDCHSGSQLTDEQFHDIGIPQTGLAVPTTADCPSGYTPCDCVAGSGCAPWGAYEGLRRLNPKSFNPMADANPWLRTGPFGDASTDVIDTSRKAYVDRALTADLKGAWRTPSLRNVALTAPYMHDGRYATLKDVVWHYNTGGRDAGPEQIGVRAAEIKPLLLTDDEQADLVAFLGTLTGTPPDSTLTSPPTLPGPGGAFFNGLPGCPPWPTGAAGTNGAGGMGGSVPPIAGASGPGMGGRGGVSAAAGRGGFPGGAGRGGFPTGAAGSGGIGGIGASGRGGGAPTDGGVPFGTCGTLIASRSITAFEDTTPTNPIRFGIAPATSGQIFSDGAGGLAPMLAIVSDGVGNRMLHALAKPAMMPPDAPFGTFDFGLRFDSPIDTTGYSALRFTINNLNSCPLTFTLRSTRVSDGGRDSQCTAQDAGDVCLQVSAPVSLNGAFCLPLTPGFIDLTSLGEIRWSASVSCGLDVTIDNVALVLQQ